MKKAILINLSVLLLTNVSCAQSIDSLKMVVNKKSLTELNAFLSKENEKYDHLLRNGYSESSLIRINHQLVDSFHVMKIDYKDYTDLKSFKNYTINLLTEKDTIIYYKIVRPHKVDEFMDEDKIEQLNKAYYRSFDITLNIEELFAHQTIYGNMCGEGGTAPEKRVALQKLVEEKNIAELDKWLRSSTIPLQVYAVEGFYQLNKSGYNITPRQREIIELIKEKEGIISICDGCEDYYRKITDITSSFVFVTHSSELNLIRSVIAQKSFIQLDSFMQARNKIIPSHDRAVGDGYMKFIDNELIDSFVVLNYLYRSPEKEDAYVEYQINLIKKSDTIIYYEIADTREDTVWVESYENKEQTIAMRQSYMEIYDCQLDFLELFSSEYLYGSTCGYVGTPPQKRVELQKLVAEKNITELNKWLCSSNVSLQVYAVDGFYQLYKAGYQLSKRQREIIKLIKKKSGEIYACFGCMHEDASIESLTREFTFD